MCVACLAPNSAIVCHKDRRQIWGKAKPHLQLLQAPTHAIMRGVALVYSCLLLGTLEAYALQPFRGEGADITWASAFFGTLFMIICSELGDKVRPLHSRFPDERKVICKHSG